MIEIGPYTYNPDEPMPPQQVDYDCSAASTAWFGRTLGWGWTEMNVLWEFNKAGLISPEWGLLDGTGAGIESWLAEQPIPASHGSLTWSDLINLAGAGPLIMGGANWYHWVGVRYSLNAQVVALANSARWYKGIGDTLNASQFQLLGPFNGVWLQAT